MRRLTLAAIAVLLIAACGSDQLAHPGPTRAQQAAAQAAAQARAALKAAADAQQAAQKAAYVKAFDQIDESLAFEQTGFIYTVDMCDILTGSCLGGVVKMGLAAQAGLAALPAAPSCLTAIDAKARAALATAHQGSLTLIDVLGHGNDHTAGVAGSQVAETGLADFNVIRAALDDNALPIDNQSHGDEVVLRGEYMLIKC